MKVISMSDEIGESEQGENCPASVSYTHLAAPSGRIRLAALRTGILFCVSAGASILLYGSDLYMGLAIYGGGIGLGRAAQSVELLGKLPQVCTVGGFLAPYFMMRIVRAFVLAMLLWLLLSAVHDVKLTLAVLAFFLSVELSLLHL